MIQVLYKHVISHKRTNVHPYLRTSTISRYVFAQTTKHSFKNEIDILIIQVYLLFAEASHTEFPIINSWQHRHGRSVGFHDRAAQVRYDQVFGC